jgi:hypothetical protein
MMMRLATCVALWQATLVCVAAPDAPLDGTDFSSSPAEGGAPAAPRLQREKRATRADRRPPAAAIVLIGGNARTFLCTFPRRADSSDDAAQRPGSILDASSINHQPTTAADARCATTHSIEPCCAATRRASR